MKFVWLACSVFISINLFAQWKPVGPVNGVPFKGFSEGKTMYTDVAVDTNNVPYIVYEDAANANKATVKKYNGSKWVIVGKAGFSAGVVTYCSIIIDKSNAPCVVYRDATNSNKATAMRYIDTGWTVVGVPGFTANQAAYTTMAMDSNGILYVAFRDNDAKASVMKFDGSAWALTGNAGLSTGNASYTCIAVDGSGFPYIAYQDNANYSSITVRKFDGTNWVNVGTPGITKKTATFTTMAIDSKGTPYIAFTDYGNSFKVSVMKYTGASWINVGPAGISPGPGQAGNISLALDRKDSLYVAYNDAMSNFTTSGYSSMMKYSGSSWVYVGDKGFSVTTANYTSMVLDRNDMPLVVYTEDVNDSKAAAMKFDGSSWVTVGGTTNYVYGISGDAVGTAEFAIAKNGKLFVAYKDQSLNSKITLRQFDGANWVTVGNAGFSDTTVLNLSMALSPEGDPYIAYIEEGGGITVKGYINNEWSVLGSRKMGMPDEYVGVKLAIGPGGDMYIFYSDDSVGGRASIKKYVAGNWEYVGDPGIDLSFGSIDYPQLSVSADGTPYIAFTDNTEYRTRCMKFNGQYWVYVGGYYFSAGAIGNTSLELDSAAMPYIAYGGFVSINGKLATVPVTKKHNGTQWVNLASDTGAVGSSTSANYLGFTLDSTGASYLVCADALTLLKATVRKYTDSGWVLIGDRGFTTGAAYSNSIKMDNTGTPYVLYADNNNAGKITIMKYSPCAGNTNTWIGTSSSAWEDPRNWSCGALPDGSTNVILNAGAVVVLNSSTAIKSFTVNGTVNFSITTDSHLAVLH